MQIFGSGMISSTNSNPDGNLNGYHKKKYVCKVSALDMLPSSTSNSLSASLYIHFGLECRLWTSRSRQPHFCQQVLGEANRIPCYDPIPPRATRAFTFGGQQYPEGSYGPQ